MCLIIRLSYHYIILLYYKTEVAPSSIKIHCHILHLYVLTLTDISPVHHYEFQNKKQVPCVMTRIVTFIN